MGGAIKRNILLNGQGPSGQFLQLLMSLEKRSKWKDHPYKVIVWPLGEDCNKVFDK